MRAVLSYCRVGGRAVLGFIVHCLLFISLGGKKEVGGGTLKKGICQGGVHLLHKKGT